MNDELAINHTADVVIVGAGGAGLAAAVTAFERGCKNIIILESRSAPGGNSVFAEGFFAINNPVLKTEDVQNLKDKLIKTTMSFTHFKSDPGLVGRLIDKSEETLKWLTHRGFRFVWKDVFHDSEIPLYASDIKAKKKTGASIIKALSEECRDKGVRIMTKTRARNLITGSNGEIIGVVAEAGGEELNIATKCVVIASGGFAGNKKMLKRYLPSFTDEVNICGVPNRGDGIQIAAKSGAGADDTIAFEMEGPTFAWTRQLPVNFLGHPYTIWINHRGERFAEELFNPFECANIINHQPGKVSFTLLDEDIKNRIIEEETDAGSDWITKLEKLIKAHSEKGRIKIADSWDEIAEWMEVSTGKLKATIKEYNSFCNVGRDAHFYKDRAYLLPLCRPPYYAIRCGISILVTHGGILVNLNMEVQDKYGNSINGLYAAGVDTGGVDSDTYNFHLPGHSFGFALSTGLIAGVNAAAYTLRK